MSEFFSGFYGMAVVFDPAMNRYCATAAIVAGLESAPRRPHITLYQAKFQNLPLKNVKDAMAAATGLIGTPFCLNAIINFADAFIFWNVERDRSSEDVWYRTQRAIAEPLLPFLDPDQPALRQGMKLSMPVSRHVECFGYALFGADFLPHITLAKKERRPPSAAAAYRHEDTVRKIAFSELEPSDGSIVELIYSIP